MASNIGFHSKRSGGWEVGGDTRRKIRTSTLSSNYKRQQKRQTMGSACSVPGDSLRLRKRAHMTSKDRFVGAPSSDGVGAAHHHRHDGSSGGHFLMSQRHHHLTAGLHHCGTMKSDDVNNNNHHNSSSSSKQHGGRKGSLRERCTAAPVTTATTASSEVGSKTTTSEASNRSFTESHRMLTFAPLFDSW